KLAAETPNVHFAGRLATYKYYNMDQVVAQALTLFNKLAIADSRIVTASGTPARSRKVFLRNNGHTNGNGNGNGHSNGWSRSSRNGKTKTSVITGRNGRSNGHAHA